MEEKIKLSEIVYLGLQLRNEPSEETLKRVNEILNALQVASYKKMSDKYVALIDVITMMASDEGGLSLANLTVDLECAKIEYGLLPYILNLEDDIKGQVDVVVCDILYELGFIDAILGHVEIARDYARFEHMVDNALNFSNIDKILTFSSNFDPENIQKFVDTVADLKDQLTGEKLKQMADISLAGSPDWEVFQKTVAEQIVENILDKRLNDLKNKENKS